MFLFRFRRAGTAVLLLLCCAAPLRVVSLNLCTDQLLLELAPEHAVALSPLARDPTLSAEAASAARLPWVRPDAEAVWLLHPDLVLTGDFGVTGTAALLRDRGVRVVQFPEAHDFAAIAEQLLQAGQVLGAEEHATMLVSEMRRALATMPATGRGRSAVFWEARGFTSGPGSLGDAVLHAAGFRNRGRGIVDVEAMVARPPDLLVTTEAPDFPSLATDMLRHPALGLLARRTVPAAWMTCGGPATVHAVERLAR